LTSRTVKKFGIDKEELERLIEVLWMSTGILTDSTEKF